MRFCSSHLRHAGADAAAGRRNGSHRPGDLRTGPAVGAAAIRRSPPSAAPANGFAIEHRRHGATEADYCVCTLPANLLARIPSDFSPAKKAALQGIEYLPSVKVAFESPRFWETDDHLYGGLAWTDRPNENVIYPSGQFHSRKGVLVAAYVAGWTNRDNPQKFAALSHEERLRISRESIEALHPGKSQLLSKGVSVAWGMVPWSEGVGAIGPNWEPTTATHATPNYSSPKARSCSRASI